MRYLESFGFPKERIDELEEKLPDVMLNAFNEAYKLVSANITFLNDLGVKNTADIFFNFYELFLLDHSNFKAIFEKYDKEDLSEKLAKNVAIVEYL